MKENARKFRDKEAKLLKLYSRWHETHDESFQRRCVSLLSEILALKPNFNIRQDFQHAF